MQDVSFSQLIYSECRAKMLIRRFMFFFSPFQKNIELIENSF